MGVLVMQRLVFIPAAIRLIVWLGFKVPSCEICEQLLVIIIDPRADFCSYSELTDSHV
jgi:hypothetical protein